MKANSIGRLVSVAALALAALAPSPAALAQSGPIKLIVPLAAGGPTDLIARMLAEKLRVALDTPVVVENRTGAGGQLAFEAVAGAAPDGNTLLITNNSISILPYTNPTFSAGFLNQITPIARIFVGTVALASSAQLPVQTLPELLSYAKANPGKLNYASQGAGDVVAHELFKSLAGIDVVTVTYRGGAPALQALLAGEVHYTMATPGAVDAHVKDGKMRILATTGVKRSPVLPNTPTMDEAGVRGFEYSFWSGLSGPANLPKAIVDRLAKATAEVVKAEDFRSRMLALGYETTGERPDFFRNLIASDTEKWGKIVKSSNLKFQ